MYYCSISLIVLALSVLSIRAYLKVMKYSSFYPIKRSIAILIFFECRTRKIYCDFKIDGSI
jgi:hypothetical protein